MSEALDRLRRWEDSGGAWRIVAETGDAVDVSLLTCDAGEEMDRIRSSEPDLRAHLRTRADEN